MERSTYLTGFVEKVGYVTMMHCRPEQCLRVRVSFHRTRLLHNLGVLSLLPFMLKQDTYVNSLEDNYSLKK